MTILALVVILAAVTLLARSLQRSEFSESWSRQQQREDWRTLPEQVCWDWDTFKKREM